MEVGIAYAPFKQGLAHESADTEALARAHLKAEQARRYHLAGFDSYCRDASVAEFFQIYYCASSLEDQRTRLEYRQRPSSFHFTMMSVNAAAVRKPRSALLWCYLL